MENQLALLISAFDCIDEGVAITLCDNSNDSLVPLFSNTGFSTLTDFTSSELKQIPLTNLLQERDRDWLLRCVKSRDNLEAKYNRDVKFINKADDEAVLQWTVSFLKLDEPETIYVVHCLKNVTQLRRLEGNSNNTQKMEAVGQLASGIAHDFNNLIGIIAGMAEIIIMKEGQDSNSASYAKKILQATRRGADIVGKLMGFSRSESSNSECIDVLESLEQIQPLVKQFLPATLQINIQCENQIPPISLTSTQFEQIILNLSTNASDAIGNRKGQINISVSLEAIEAELANNLTPSIPKGNYVCIRFSDTGSGIPDKELVRIFEPFYTTKETGKGTGLGLASIYGIIQQASGGLSVRSEVGKGTEFILYFPPYVSDELISISKITTPLKATHTERSLLSLVTKDEKIVMVKSGQPSLYRIILNAIKAKDISVRQDPQNSFDLLSLWSSKTKVLVTIIDYSILKDKYPDEFPQKLYSAPNCPIILIVEKCSKDFDTDKLPDNIIVHHPPVPLRRLIHQVESFCQPTEAITVAAAVTPMTRTIDSDSLSIIPLP